MFTTATLTVGAQAMADLITHLSLHDAGDVSSSADETAVDRQPVSWVNVDGTLTGTVLFDGGVTDESPTRIGYWSAVTGGTYHGGQFRRDGAPGFSETGHLEVTVIESGYSA